MSQSRGGFIVGYALYSAVTVTYFFAALYVYKSGAPATTTYLAIINAIIMLAIPLFLGDELEPLDRLHRMITEAITLMNFMAAGFAFFVKLLKEFVRYYMGGSVNPIPPEKIFYGLVELVMFPVFFTIATFLYRLAYETPPPSEWVALSARRASIRGTGASPPPLNRKIFARQAK